MPKINLNVVIVCGSPIVDLNKFTAILTESYLPDLQVSVQNGCQVARTLIVSNQTAVFEDLIPGSEQKEEAYELDI